MTTSINQKAYLQKYLGGSSGDKKKKKKKAVKGTGLKIIDDDIDLSKLRPLDGDELDIFDEGEDAPQIAGIIDDRPEELKQLEQLKTSSKWKVVNQDDGFNSKLQIEEIKKDIKETEKENELIFGKMYSDSEDEKKNDSDISPPRNNSKKHNSDSDISPPRKHNQSPTRKSRKSPKRRDSSDISPPRKNNQSPTRKSRKSPKRRDSSDISPPRKNNQSPSRKSKKLTNRRDSDISPPRKHQSPSRKLKRSPNRRYSSDVSPPRKSKKSPNRKYSSDLSPPRKSRRSPNRKYNGDSDQSPPRRGKERNFTERDKKRANDSSPTMYRKKSRVDSQENDKFRRKEYEDKTSGRNANAGSKKGKRDTSEERQKQKESDNKQRKRSRWASPSPPRKEKDAPERERNKRANESPPPSNKKMARTLEGKMAGLQDARQLRQENDEFRRKEDEVFNKMSDEVSGRNAKAVSRKGKRETSEERQKLKEKADRQREIDEKYKKWSRGLKQIEDQEARVQEFMHEASKPLARHKGDKDLEDNLKQIERAGDPMLNYIREKKRERGELGPERPSYKGSFPPNRFNIRPGYRWDGVDRSNGYEKKYFEQQSKKKAQEEEAYKWSTEDL